MPRKKRKKRKKKIVLFLGAGASAPFGYPTTKPFVKNLEENLRGPLKELLNDLLKVKDVEDIEHVIEILDSVDSFLTTDTLRRFFAAFPFSLGIGGASRTWADVQRQCKQLKEKIIDQIYKEYETNPDVINDITIAYEELFGILSYYQEEGADIIVFTTNYDRVIEEFCANSTSYDLVDGFAHDPFARMYKWKPEEFEKARTVHSLVKLFKLHGSLNWRKTRRGKAVQIRSEERTIGGRLYRENILIYPASPERPTEEPFATLYEYFGKHLHDADVLISIGFSFRDDYINELVIRSVERTKKISIIGVGSDLRPIVSVLGIEKLSDLIALAPQFPKNHKLIYDSLAKL